MCLKALRFCFVIFIAQPGNVFSLISEIYSLAGALSTAYLAFLLFLKKVLSIQSQSLLSFNLVSFFLFLNIRYFVFIIQIALPFPSPYIPSIYFPFVSEF